MRSRTLRRSKPRLEGREVCILADGSVEPKQVVTGGKITLAQLDELKDRAFKEVRETFCRTVKGDE